MKFAQAVNVEAELHRRRFPNLACGGSAFTAREDPYGAYSRQQPVRDRASPAGTTALGMPSIVYMTAFGNNRG